MAEPPAPAISSAVAIGAACWTTASTDAEPVNDCAPNCLIRLPTWSAMTAPNGMATRAVGMIVTEAMNQACWMNSRVWKGRLNKLRATSRPNAKSFPAVPIGARTRLATSGGHQVDQPPVVMDMFSSNEPGGGSMPFSLHQAPGSRWLRRGLPLEGSSWSGIGRQRRQLHVLLGLELVGVLLLGHADRADHLGVEELAHDRLLGGEQHLAGAEHRQVLVVEQADVVRHLAGRVDVVGDDQERRVDLRVQVDDELVQERRTDRVEAGVGLVEQHDLGVEHQGAGQAGALAHAAGDLAGELVLGAEQADQVDLLHHDVADLGLGLLGVLAQREGDVVVEVHRAEHGAVLEQHAEELADLVELLLGARGDVDALDDTLPLSGLSRPMMVFSRTDLPVPDGPSITQISPAGMVRVTSPQISCLPKLFVRSVDLDLNTHRRPSLVLSDSDDLGPGSAAARSGSPHPRRTNE